MPGTIQRVLPKTKYDFANIPASGSLDLILAKNVDLSQYTQAALKLRLHDKSVSGGSGNWAANVKVIPDAPTAEDPSVDWVFAGTESANVDLTGGSMTAGVFALDELTTPFGATVKLVLSITQSSPNKETAFTLTISADIEAKSG